MAAVNPNLPELPQGQETQAQLANAIKSLAENAGREELAQGSNSQAEAPKLPDPNVSPQDLAKPKSLIERIPSLQGVVRDSFVLPELAAALASVGSSFASQADDIHRTNSSIQDKQAGTMLSFAADFLQTLTAPLRWLNERSNKTTIRDPYDERKQNTNVKDIFRANTPGRILQKLSHHQVVKQFISLLFNFRRIRFNFSPDSFKVPSGKGKRDAKRAKPSTTIALRWLDTLMQPARLAATLFGTVTTLPSQMLSFVAAFTGNQKGFDTSQYFKKLTSVFTPLIANLSSLYSTSRAFTESATGNKYPLKVTFAKYHISYSNIIQGLLSSVIAIPHLMGVVHKFSENFTEVNDNHDPDDPLSTVPKYKFTDKLADLCEDMGATFKNIVPGFDPLAMKETTRKHFDKYIEDYKKISYQFTKGLFSKRWFIGRMLNGYSPYDDNSTNYDDSMQSSRNPDQQYILGYFKKSTLYKDFFELLHPIQSMLMVLPNAFTRLKDVYIRDNAIVPIRFLDKALGASSVLLSLPSYLSYIAQTRLPQVILKVFELKTRKDAQKEFRGEISKAETYKEYKKFIQQLKDSDIPLTTSIANCLESLGVSNNDLIFREDMLEKYQKLDDEAQLQEPNVKASELISSIRIGIRSLLTGPLGKVLIAGRDEDGLTAQEHQSMNIYKMLETPAGFVKGLPIIGSFLGPIADAARNFYYVPPNPDWEQLENT